MAFERQQDAEECVKSLDGCSVVQKGAGSASEKGVKIELRKGHIIAKLVG